jgi:ergothioneine biosynthesis protein EgtB
MRERTTRPHAARNAVTARRPTGGALALAERYCEVRRATEALCDPLSPEDLCVQSTPEANPVKWHLAHTAWFFERLILAERSDYEPFDRQFEYLFNSGYETWGPSLPSQERGRLSRPTASQIADYRRHVDAGILALLCYDDHLEPELAWRIELGLHHELQHQELMLADIKHAFATSVAQPAYQRRLYDSTAHAATVAPLAFTAYPATIAWIGHGNDGFCFDNERPRHQTLVPAFELAQRLVTVGEYLEFIEDGGYRRPELWLAAGWDRVKAQSFAAPLYWLRRDSGGWVQGTLGGVRPLVLDEPVCHLSYYEAEAYARWAKARLPTEQEWEVAAAALTVEGNLLERGVLHPQPLPANDDARHGAPQQLFGDVWEWTSSAHQAYPGFVPWPGALTEYNAKFMVETMVVRGGSCVTPRALVRPSYRGYLRPVTRLQFTGIRLARS